MPGEFRKRELVGDCLIVSHLVDDAHEGWRADRFVKAQYKYLSRTKLQRLIEDGVILIEGRRLKPSSTVRAGERVQVHSRWLESEEPPVNFNYGVLYEDEEILVVDKPGHLPVHPAGKFLFHTLLMHLRQTRGGDFFLIHRIDRETSGVLLLAKTSRMAGLLVPQFFRRETIKRYLAVVHGHLPVEEMTIDADMGPAAGSVIRLKMGAFPKGSGQGSLEALTLVRRLRSGVNTDLVECELKTGRQHQIRVHLAYVGHPIVGDKLYGPNETDFLNYLKDRMNSYAMGRHALHSAYLKFYHPHQKTWLEIESPLPQDLACLLDTNTSTNSANPAPDSARVM